MLIFYAIFFPVERKGWNDETIRVSGLSIEMEKVARNNFFPSIRGL